jgi:ABC-type transport system substrate-binding protein
LRWKAGRPLQFTLTTVAGDLLRMQIQAALIAQWSAIGARVTVRNTDPGSLFSGFYQGGLLEHGQFQAGLWTWNVGPDPDGLFPIDDSAEIPELSNHGQGSNFGRFHDPAIDRDLLLGRSTLDPDQRARAYSSFTAEYLRAGFELPLYERMIVVLASPRLHNLELSPEPGGTMWNAADWWVDS